MTDRRGRGDHIGDHLVQALFGESIDRTGYRQGGDHFAGVVADRRGDRVESLLQFLDGECVSVPRGRLDLRVEFPVRRDRAG